MIDGALNDPCDVPSDILGGGGELVDEVVESRHGEKRERVREGKGRREGLGELEGVSAAAGSLILRNQRLDEEGESERKHMYPSERSRSLNEGAK